MGILIADTVQVDTIKNESGALTNKGVLQVVSASKTDTFTTTSTSNVDMTGMTVTLTPRSTDSQVLIFGNVSGANSGDGHVWFVQLVRAISGGATTDIAKNTQSGVSQPATLAGLSYQDYELNAEGFNFLDSPSTTSAITYHIEVASGSGANTAVFNRRADNSDQGGISSITAMEIQG